MPETTSVKGRIIASLMQETLDYVATLEGQVATLEEENKLLRDNPIPPVVSMSFIADYAGVSLSMVSDWLRRGVIRAKKPGGRWIVKREDFLSWLNDEEKPKLARAK